MDYSKYNKDNSIVAVARALDIIDLIFNEGKPLKMTYISETLSIPKVTTFRTLNTLVEKKYLSKRQDDTYFLGLKFITIGNVAKSTTSLVSIAKPHTERLRDVTGESVNLGVLTNDQVCNIIHESGEAFLLMATLFPLSSLHCASIGKTFLLHMSEEDRKEYFSRPLKKMTKYTITKLEDFEETIARFEEESVVYDHEEFEYGLSCIAAPVYDCNGKILAGVSVTGPSSRLHEKNTETLKKHLLTCASSISEDLWVAQYKVADFYNAYG